MALEKTDGDHSRMIHPQARIGHVHLKVADLERAIGFYRHLGWREVGEGTADTGPWVRLRK